MDKLLIKTGRNYYLIKKSDILFIRSDGSYSRLFCKDGKSYLIRRSLSYIEDYLGRNRFVRINKSSIVNIEKIGEMKKSDEDNYIVLTDKTILNCSRKYSTELLKMIDG